MNRLTFLIILLSVFLSACKVTQQSTQASITQFDKAQTTLITSGGSQDPMRVFKINNYQDSILLRTRCQNVVVDSTDQVLKTCIDRVYATVRDSMSLGVGIAAPQVGILKNIIWVQRFDKEAFPFEYYLNPRILQYTEKKQDCREGCLSIPDRSDTTKTRAYAILLEYDNFESLNNVEMVEGFTAVIFQHEIDHLNGILYLDHLEQEIKEASY